MAEDCHADDGIDEGDEGEEGPDVEEGRKWHYQGEQQFADPFGGLKEIMVIPSY